MNTEKRYSQDDALQAFRYEARLLIQSLGGNVDEAARRLGLASETLRAWLVEGDPRPNGPKAGIRP